MPSLFVVAPAPQSERVAWHFLLNRVVGEMVPGGFRVSLHLVLIVCAGLSWGLVKAAQFDWLPFGLENHPSVFILPLVAVLALAIYGGISRAR